MDRIIFLGQGGLFFQQGNVKIMIDPYLSDSVGKINPKKIRKSAVPEEIFELEPNVMIFTHNHLDHYDPETVEKFIKPDTKITVLAPESVWNEVRKIGGDNNYIKFQRHTMWTQDGVEFVAVKAEHSDKSPIGVIINDGKKKFYVTGDTLYNEDIFEDIPGDIFALFLPINGEGNNMNQEDAKKFAKRVNAKKTIPIHFGLLDDIIPEGFDVVPQNYKEIVL